MSLRVNHTGGHVARGMFRLVLVDVRRQRVCGARTAGAAAAAAAATCDRAPGATGRRVVRARRAHAGSLPHAGQSIKRRRFHSLDQAVQGLDRLQFGHHFV